MNDNGPLVGRLERAIQLFESIIDSRRNRGKNTDKSEKMLFALKNSCADCGWMPADQDDLHVAEECTVRRTLKI